MLILVPPVPAALSFAFQLSLVCTNRDFTVAGWHKGLLTKDATGLKTRAVRVFEMCLVPRGFCRVYKAKKGGGLMQAARLPLRVHLAEASRGKSLPLSGSSSIWDGFLVPSGVLAEPPGPTTTSTCQSFSQNPCFFSCHLLTAFLWQTHVTPCYMLPPMQSRAKQTAPEEMFPKGFSWGVDEHLSVCNKLIKRQTCRWRPRIYEVYTN